MNNDNKLKNDCKEGTGVHTHLKDEDSNNEKTNIRKKIDKVVTCVLVTVGGISILLMVATILFGNFWDSILGYSSLPINDLAGDIMTAAGFILSLLSFKHIKRWLTQGLLDHYGKITYFFSLCIIILGVALTIAALNYKLHVPIYLINITSFVFILIAVSQY